MQILEISVEMMDFPLSKCLRGGAEKFSNWNEIVNYDEDFCYHQVGGIWYIVQNHNAFFHSKRVSKICMHAI